MGKQQIVVLGAGYAGVLCALRLARTRARVTLVNAAPHFVERIRLHELATGRAPRPRALAELVAGTGVELHVGWAEATSGQLSLAGATRAVRPRARRNRREGGLRFALAYRMLGSVSEAEDVLQDAAIRARDAGRPESPAVWLRTTVTRLCLDQLKHLA